MASPRPSKPLKVIEKFRARAALYTPSTRKGGGWIEISGPELRGEVVIQLQEDAGRHHCYNGKKYIPVVRFHFRHGKDFVNARIQDKMPIHRKGKRKVLFKCLSSSFSSGDRCKILCCLVFEKEEDTNDFMMWWLAKNGSTPLGYENNEKLLKRKISDTKDCGRDSGFTPKKKKPRASSRTKDVLHNSTNSAGSSDTGAVGFDNNHTSNTDGTGLLNTSAKDSNDITLAVNDEESKAVAIDEDNYVPKSQNWMSAFSPPNGDSSDNG